MSVEIISLTISKVHFNFKMASPPNSFCLAKNFNIDPLCPKLTLIFPFKLYNQ